MERAAGKDSRELRCCVWLPLLFGTKDGCDVVNVSASRALKLEFWKCCSFFLLFPHFLIWRRELQHGRLRGKLNSGITPATLALINSSNRTLFFYFLLSASLCLGALVTGGGTFSLSANENFSVSSAPSVRVCVCVCAGVRACEAH